MKLPLKVFGSTSIIVDADNALVANANGVDTAAALCRAANGYDALRAALIKIKVNAAEGGLVQYVADEALANA